MNYCSIENKLCSIATNEGKCPISACIKKNETVHSVYKEGRKVWPPEDPVDIHDEISKGFARIENVIREETAKISEIIREAVVQKDTYVYKPTAPTIYWPNNGIPEACRSCANHPSNGGTILKTDWGYFEEGLDEIRDYCERLDGDHKTEPQTDCPKSCPSRDICTKDETDCAWK